MPAYQAMDHDGPPEIGDYLADFLRYEVTDMTPLEFLTSLNFTSDYIDKVFEAYPDLKTQTTTGVH